MQDKDYIRYYNEFRSKGLSFTQGYLEGRNGRISNLFSVRYEAARKALDDLLASKISERKQLEGRHQK